MVDAAQSPSLIYHLLSMSADDGEFERQFAAFKKFVEEKNVVAFTSFASHPYIKDQEGYKDEIHRAAREALAFQSWKKSDIGNGKILTSVIRAIEIPKNNLVQWLGRYGKEARPHQPLYTAQKEQTERQRSEACLFKLYNELFIHPEMQLQKIEPQHNPYLAYHREHIYK